MGKGIGLISGHTKKVGNTVGFRNSASNNGQTQGYRVYQPIVRNPQTAAQAEQRAKTAAINATYSHLKMIIDRGNESLPYGNRSRCAWLKKAFKATELPWFEKGSIPTHFVGCQLTKGSLDSIGSYPSGNLVNINCDGVTTSSDVSTISKVSELLKGAYPFLKENDQVTIIVAIPGSNAPRVNINSFVIDSTSTTAQSLLTAANNQLQFEADDSIICSAVIVSRQGVNGAHLRSTESLFIPSETLYDAPYDDASKAAAIASYQTSQSANTDWQEDSQ